MKKYQNNKELLLIKKLRNQVLNGLHDRLKELKAEEGITAEIMKAQDGNEAIIGSYKNEPFCVYYIKMVVSNGEYACMLMTRWKGKDHRMKKPVDVLSGG